MNKLHLNNEETNGFFIYPTDNDEHFEEKKILTQVKGIETESKSNNNFVDKN